MSPICCCGYLMSLNLTAFQQNPEWDFYLCKECYNTQFTICKGKLIYYVIKINDYDLRAALATNHLHIYYPSNQLIPIIQTAFVPLPLLNYYQHAQQLLQRLLNLKAFS